MLLGRAPRPAGARFARLRDHLTVPLPAAPASWDGLIDTVTLRMLGNDRYGDCTFAAVGNLAAIQSAGDGLPMVLEEKLVVSEYLDHTDGRDEGAVVIDVLNRVRGRGLGAYRLRAWAALDLGDREGLCAAAAMFQGVYLGVDLPDDWHDGVAAGLWDVTGPGRWDKGHALVLAAYDADGVTLATWGHPLRATWEWLAAYAVEAYVLLDETRLSVDVLNGTGLVATAASLARENGAGS